MFSCYCSWWFYDLFHRYLLMIMPFNLLGMKSNDILYNPNPLYHTAGGMLGVGFAILKGVPSVLRTKFSVTAYWTDCIKYNCTVSGFRKFRLSIAVKLMHNTIWIFFFHLFVIWMTITVWKLRKFDAWLREKLRTVQIRIFSWSLQIIIYIIKTLFAAMRTRKTN